MQKKFEQKSKKLNTALCILLVVIMSVMFINYAIMTITEVKLSKMSTETMILNNENLELQNKLDNLMSYHNVEQTVKENGMLDIAEKVIELKKINKPQTGKIIPKYTTSKHYHHSVGF